MKFCEGVREKGQIKKTERKEASSEKSQNLNGPKVSESASGKNRVKNLNATKKDVRRNLFNEQPCILVRFRQNYLSLSNINENLPSVFQCLLQDYEDVFSEAPKGLPPLRGIVHQIDLVPGASIPNQPAYRSNPEETKDCKGKLRSY